MDHLVNRTAPTIEFPTSEYAPLTIGSEPTLKPVPSAVGSFERIEDKFMIEKGERATLLARIREALPPSPYSGKNFTEIESIYFDSPALTSFTDHFESGRSRFKLRTRRYGPDGTFPDDHVYHLELKTKSPDGVSRKTRFKVRAEDFAHLSEGRPLELGRPLLTLNSEMEPKVLARRVREVNALVEKYYLRPVMRLNYQRVAYESGNLRVTLDDQVQVRPLREMPIRDIMENRFSARVGAKLMRNLFEERTYSLLEVKHPGKIPAWLTHSLTELGIPERSFSKYCYSIAASAL